MADDIDRAGDLEEKCRDAALAFRKPEGPTATGRCLWCDESVPQGHRWCSAQHRDEWERVTRLYRNQPW